MGFILPWSLFWRWGKYAPCGLLANFRADTSITTQAIFQKRKRPAFPRIIAEFASLMEVTTRFELVNEGFADLCLTTWPRHHMSRNCFLLFFWSGRRGSNSLPPPWQGGALPDELRPHGVCSLRRTYKKMVPPIGIEPMTRGFSVPCSTD